MKMNEFIKFFDKVTEYYPMHLEIYYSKITDWSIRVYKKGCGKKYGSDLEILSIQDCDVDLVFAKAQVELKEWLSDNEGGY
jgi:hypothetical protein